jgi:hypothetical protein
MQTKTSSHGLWKAFGLVVVSLILTLAFPPSVGASTTLDKVSSRPGTLQGAADYTSAGGGHTATAGDYAMNLPNGGGWIEADAAFLNAYTVNNKISVAFWAKNSDVFHFSAFKFASATGGGSNPTEGLEAIYYDDFNGPNDLYYDNSGCCTSPFRMHKSVTLFPSYTGNSWWTDGWHFWVFSFYDGNKEVWIDGQPFITAAEASGFAPLKTDHTTMSIGSGAGGPLHGLIDDFSIYSEPLTEENITNLFNGTLPSALPSGVGLIAWWDFNDFPPNGVFKSVLPAPDALAAAPDLVQVVHIDGAAPWTSGNVSLKIDGTLVATTFNKVNDQATVSYVPSPLFASGSIHTALLTYPGTNGPTTTLQWQFVVGRYTKDVVAQRIGALQGNAVQTPNGGGHTGIAGDYGLDLPPTGGYVAMNAAFMNAASANDQITLAFWLKNRLPGSTDCNSPFQVTSPSAAQQRGMEAHVPCEYDVYYDTSGYTGSQYRISKSILSYSGYTGNDTWWTGSWHLWVFTKNAGVKQIWIDGTLFHEGTGAAPLFTDFQQLLFGAGHAPFNGLVDDLSVYSTALSGTDIASLYSGTLPTALAPAAGLMAFWDFNGAIDIAPNGVFESVAPAANSVNNSPEVEVTVVHYDGATPWTAGNVSLKIDNGLVASSFSKVGDKATVTYAPPTIYASGSTHTATLTYPGTNGPTTTLQWQFSIRTYDKITKDVVSSRRGYLYGQAAWTPGAGGHTGAAGDFGMDVPTVGGWVSIDGAFMNAATVNDQLSFAFWAKNRLPGSTDCNSIFWVYSASATDGTPPQHRGWEAHVPCEYDVYFDTSGYIGPTKRISASILTFPGYTGNDGWWTNSWHFWVFSKNGDVKQIWIDGILFTQGTGAVPLNSDFAEMIFGGGHGPYSGLLDDFSIYSKALSGTDIANLYTGTLPTALPGSAGLMAWWNFNDSPPSLIIERAGTQVKITYEGTLESTAAIGDAWNPVSGASSPFFVSPSGNAFYRARR